MSVSARASDPGQIDLCKPLVFDVTGMDCGDCARSVERVVGQLPQVDNATVSFASGTLTVKPHEAGENPDDVVRSVGGAVDRAGYTAVLREKFGGRRVSALPWWRNRKLIPAVAATVLWVAAFVVGQTVETEVWSTALYAVAIVVGGMPIMRSGLVALTARRIDMNVLMTISVIGAALLGEWSEGGLVVVLFSIGTTLQAVTFDRTRNAIRALLDLAPDEARVVRDGVETLVAVHSLQVDDVVRVRPGDRLPADGEVIDGHSAMDQAAITGESLPVERGVGDEVYAGTVNGSGTVLVRVTKLSSESMLANIVHLVEEAQSSRAPSQQLVDRFAAVYTPAVVAVAALIALGVGGFSGNWDTGAAGNRLPVRAGDLDTGRDRLRNRGGNPRRHAGQGRRGARRRRTGEDGRVRQDRDIDHGSPHGRQPNPIWRCR
jgi:Cd2+/Zn2+-exporting ATPase